MPRWEKPNWEDFYDHVFWWENMISAHKRKFIFPISEPDIWWSLRFVRRVVADPFSNIFQTCGFFFGSALSWTVFLVLVTLLVSLISVIFTRLETSLAESCVETPPGSSSATISETSWQKYYHCCCPIKPNICQGWSYFMTKVFFTSLTVSLRKILETETWMMMILVMVSEWWWCHDWGQSVQWHYSGAEASDGDRLRQFKQMIITTPRYQSTK